MGQARSCQEDASTVHSYIAFCFVDEIKRFFHFKRYIVKVNSLDLKENMLCKVPLLGLLKIKLCLSKACPESALC